MSHTVSPQIDVGSVTLRGLSAFTPLLAALTADDVAPMAMVQLESLGSLFHVSGPYAVRIPDLLQRYSSTRLHHLGLSVGWRKGDSASLMAQSAGGQAISLVCWFLSNCCSRGDCALTLAELSERCLPVRASICSPTQIKSVVGLLSSKLQVLGFGNIIAQQTIWIHAIYEQLSRPVPLHLHHSLTQESNVELLASMSRALSEEDCLVRVRGVQGMGCIIALALMMFPSDTRLVVEGLVVRQGARVSIILELDSSSELSYPIQIQLETKLCDHESTRVPIHTRTPASDGQWPAFNHFRWNNHIADALQLAFANVGLNCSRELLVACCDVLRTAVKSMDMFDTEQSYLLDLRYVSALLGDEPVQHIFDVCRTTFGVTPSGQTKDLKSAFSRLVDVFTADTDSTISCTCRKCDISMGWYFVGLASKDQQVRNCLFCLLWLRVGAAVNHAFLCLFAEASGQATIRCDFLVYRMGSVAVAVHDLWTLDRHSLRYTSAALHRDMMSLMGGNDRTLACSDRSSTIYLEALVRLSSSMDKGLRYHILAGQLVVKEQYQDYLVSVPVEPRQRAAKSLYNPDDQVRPGFSGAHSGFEHTIKRRINFAELRTTILIEGQSIPLNLTDSIIASFGCRSAGVCDHSLSTPLSAEEHADAYSTSVAAPQAPESKLAIVQTKGNATAQLFACVPNTPSLLQRDCCLPCAYQRAKAEKIDMIIVA